MIRTLADETRSAKYAHVERERRWLIDPGQAPGADAAGIVIEDRYVTGTRMRLRRMSDAATGRVALKLTKKYEADDPLARPIVTTYLTDDEYAVLATLPATTLTKRRVPHAVDGQIYSFDHFGGRLAGLVLAEIEWDDDAGLRRLPPPPGAIREVSDEPCYEGGSLAIRGIPKD